MNNKKSLTFKVASNVTITSLIMLIVMGIIVFSQTSSLTKSLVQRDLLEQARKIAFFIDNDNERITLNIPRKYREYYSDGTDNHQYAVLNAGNKILFKSKNFSKENIENTLKEGGEYYFSFKSEDEKIYTGIKYDYLYNEKIYPIYILEYKKEFSEFIDNLRLSFLKNLFILAVPLVIIQGILVILIFRKSLYPVFKVARDARNIKYDNLSFRLSEKDIYIEILPLIQKVNNGLARLEKSAEAQKFFIANAAHELRTPISILKARISSLKNEKEIFLLHDDLKNINRLISQMLDISRLDIAEEAPKNIIKINDIAQKACADIGDLFITDGRELSLEDRHKNQTIYGNQDILFRAILNLLENALKHTPPKTPVEVIIDKNKITVRDYGDPIPETYRDKIFEKFEKLPESISERGSGLGLSIVKKAAEIHKAKAYLDVRSDGNDFIIDFLD